MKLILHIGTEKTGTTTLQDTLYFNREALKKNGILYPNCFGMSNHVGFCLAFQNYNAASELYAVVGIENEEHSVKEYKKNIVAKLTEEIKNSGCDLVIISNEHLHSRIKTKEEVEAIYSWALTIFDEVEVSVYLRSQSELAISHYSTLIKSGVSPESTFPSFALDTAYYNYEKLLALWSSHFVNVSVRLFDREKLRNGDVVDDFVAHFCSVEVSEILTKKRDSNKSLSCEALFILNRLNADFPFLDNGKINVSRRHLVELFERSGIGSKFSASAEERLVFDSQFEASNSVVSEKYFSGERLFNAKKLTDSGKGFSDLTTEDLLATVSGFWKSTSEMLNFFESRNQAFQAKIAMSEDRFEDAIKYLSKAEEINPDLPLVKKYKSEAIGNIKLK